MIHDHRMIERDLVEIMHVELAAILDFGVVKKLSFHPGTRRCGAGARLELVDDAVDGDELDLVGVADDNVVEQAGSGRVIVTVDETRDHRHPLGIERLRLAPRQSSDVGGRADGHEPAVLDREGLRLRHAVVDRVDIGVDDDHVRGARSSGADRPRRYRGQQTGCAQAASPSHEIPTVPARVCHDISPAFAVDRNRPAITCSGCRLVS